MRALQRLLGVVAVVSILYALAVPIIGPLTIPHALITVTAIDQWHPNWPGTAAVDRVAEASGLYAALLAPVATVAYLIVGRRNARVLHWSAGPSGAVMQGSLPAMATARYHPAYAPRPSELHVDLVAMLRDVGVDPSKAAEAASLAMTATSLDDKDPGTSIGAVRAHALDLAGVTGPWMEVRSRERGVDETARFLRDYGYGASVMRGSLYFGDQEPLNFDGLLVLYRTDSTAAESALVELLVSAHQAHMAAMADNGGPRDADRVEHCTQALRRVALKLALRGFVPPELDAEIGRDGTATAEELERWAVAQVVTTCSPMARMPLVTVERAGGAR